MSASDQVELTALLLYFVLPLVLMASVTAFFLWRAHRR